MPQDDYYFDDPVEPVLRPRRRLPVIASATAAVLFGGYLFFQTTFAANISINTGGGIEFGQGSTQTVACSGGTALSVTPIARFSNGSGRFNFESITVSNIPSSCYGVDFTLSAWDSGTATPLPLFASNDPTATVYDNNGYFYASTGSDALSVSTNSTNSFSIRFMTPLTAANSVAKVTIQSSSHGTWTVGQTGPGGGVIFYVNPAGFSVTGLGGTMHYLEYAPNGWYSGNSGYDPYADWCPTTNNSQTVGASGTAIGTGYYNTYLMNTVNGGCTGGAGYYVWNYAGDDASLHQWYLPAKDELNELCKYAHGETTGNPAVACDNTNALGLNWIQNNAYYTWSSTEYPGATATDVYNVHFADGTSSHGNYKSGSQLYARAIRAFG